MRQPGRELSGHGPLSAAPVSHVSAPQQRGPAIPYGAWLALAIILVTASIMRLAGLDREGFWGDEYAQTQLYRIPLHYTVWYALKQHGFGPPDFIIGWLAYHVNPSVWMCRLPSALWGVVTVAGGFMLGRRLASWREGLLVAALLCTSRMLLVLSQDARPYSICLAFLILTLLAWMRAMERPTWKRIVVYAATAYVFLLTRSFTPAVCVLVIGLVLTGAILWDRRRRRRDDLAESAVRTEHTRALARLWVATFVVGLAALPPMLYSLWTSEQLAFARGFVPNHYGLDSSYVIKLANYGAVAGRVLYAGYGAPVLGLALAGVMVLARRWSRLDPSKRCIFAVMLIVGPVFLVAYTLVARNHLMYDRYNFYLMPSVAVLASIGAMAVLQRLWWRLPRANAVRYSVIAAALAAVLVHPTMMSIEEMQSYRRRDWRGCAAYLADRVTSDDVVMVLADLPFGRIQQPFFGKYEWEPSDRPLGEAVWTLASSDLHFERLGRQSGRCYAILSYPIEPQAKDAYLDQGLSSAPPGYVLKKFRGLDVLIRTEPADRLLDDAVAVCSDLASLKYTYPSTNAIPLLLKSRLLHRMGKNAESERSRMEAARLVPDTQADYLEYATSGWGEQTTARKG